MKYALLLTPKEVLEGVGSRLKALRESSGLSRGDLAARSGVSSQTIGRFENNKDTSIKLDNLVKLAFALNAESGFNELFQPPKYNSIDEYIEQNK